MFDVLKKSNTPDSAKTPSETADYVFALEELVITSQELARARSLKEILEIVRIAGRQLNNADGAAFVLKDGDKCYYVEENAIGPLWKGKKFPLTMCISGWTMLNRQPAMIEDIYQDDRIPHDAYRPTFVKSLLMVPVRKNNPVAAIGNYWSSHHKVSEYEITILEMLADSVAAAMENVKYYDEINERLKSSEAK